MLGTVTRAPATPPHFDARHAARDFFTRSRDNCRPLRMVRRKISASHSLVLRIQAFLRKKSE